jgi:hypothetical protein
LGGHATVPRLNWYEVDQAFGEISLTRIAVNNKERMPPDGPEPAHLHYSGAGLYELRRGKPCPGPLLHGVFGHADCRAGS